MTKKPVLYKSLVVGVIVLFIGVGIQPAFAVTPDISKSDDDCNLCPKKGTLQNLPLIANILDRLDKFESKQVKEEISTLVKDNPYPKICDKLGEILSKLTEKCEYWSELWHLHPLRIIWTVIFYPPTFVFCVMAMSVLLTMALLNCYYYIS